MVDKQMKNNAKVVKSGSNSNASPQRALDQGAPGTLVLLDIVKKLFMFYNECFGGYVARL